MLYSTNSIFPFFVTYSSGRHFGKGDWLKTFVTSHFSYTDRLFLFLFKGSYHSLPSAQCVLPYLLIHISLQSTKSYLDRLDISSVQPNVVSTACAVTILGFYMGDIMPSVFTKMKGIFHLKWLLWIRSQKWNI